MFVLRQALAALGFCGGVHLFARVRVCLLVIGFVIYWLIFGRNQNPYGKSIRSIFSHGLWLGSESL